MAAEKKDTGARVAKFFGIDTSRPEGYVPDLNDADYLYVEQEPTVWEYFQEITPSLAQVGNYFYRLFPFLSWIGNYNLTWLTGDLIAGKCPPSGAPIGCAIEFQLAYLLTIPFNYRHHRRRRRRPPIDGLCQARRPPC
jgi:sodium-independent sulfate anion transporter 11